MHIGIDFDKIGIADSKELVEVTEKFSSIPYMIFERDNGIFIMLEDKIHNDIIQQSFFHGLAISKNINMTQDEFTDFYNKFSTDIAKAGWELDGSTLNAKEWRYTK